LDRPTGLAERWQMLRHEWVLILTAAVVTTLGAIVYSIGQAESFVAVSRVFVQPVLLQGTVTPQDRFGTNVDSLALSEPIDTQAEIAVGVEVTRRVTEAVPGWMMAVTSVNARPVTEDVLEIQAVSSDPLAATRVVNEYAIGFIQARQGVVQEAVRTAVTDLDRRISGIEARLAELQAQLSSSTLTVAEATIARIELDALTDSLGALNVKRDERQSDVLSISGGGEVLVKAAGASGESATPVRDGTVGLIIGLILGIGLAFLRGSANRRIYTLDGASEATGHEVLAAIPRRRMVSVERFGIGRNGVEQLSSGVSLGGFSNTGKTEMDPVDDAGRLWLPPATISAVSTLRSALIVRGFGERYRRLILLPSEPDDESTVATLGLAWACAHAGLRTVAVDAAIGADARDPLLGLLGPGLSELLGADAELPSVFLRWTSTPMLGVLPAGRSLAPVGDALAGTTPRIVVDALSDMTDVLLVRSPAASLGGDAVTWTALGDAVLLVLRAGVSRPGAAGRASRLARSTGIPVLGVVLTDANTQDVTVGVPDDSGSARGVGTTEGNGHGPAVEAPAPARSSKRRSATSPRSPS
jgi:Mrp family chromosome partitioning ATPase